jgi:hypothetical protein
MSLHARLQRVEHRANGYGLQHTPGVILYAHEEDIPRLIARATVCPCCVVHVVQPEKGRGMDEL